jgi:SAM-dependent methyltransferase
VFAERYVRAQPGQRVLDIGCGTGILLGYLPAVEYVGFDPSDDYITSAQARPVRGARFFVGDVNDIDPASLGRFDVVVALGVLHHLDDTAAARLFDIAATVLDDGRLVTIDPCYSPNQSRLSRAVVARDRGGAVRTVDAYRALAARRFADVQTHEHHDLLTIPYSHVVLECRGVRTVSDDVEHAAESRPA